MFKKFLVNKLNGTVVKLLEEVYPEMDFKIEEKRIIEFTIAAKTVNELSLDEINQIEDVTDYNFCKVLKEDDEDYYESIFIRHEIKEIC